MFLKRSLVFPILLFSLFLCIDHWRRLSYLFLDKLLYILGFPSGSDGEESACNVGVPGSILGQEDPLENGINIYSSSLTCRIPWIEKPGRLGHSPWGCRVRHDWANNTFSIFTEIIESETLSIGMEMLTTQKQKNTYYYKLIRHKIHLTWSSTYFTYLH